MMDVSKLKVLIISQDLPPAVGGSPILMDNLFSYFPGKLRGITGYHGTQYDANFTPSFPVTYIKPPEIPIIGGFLKKHHDRLLRYFHWFIVRKAKKIVNEYKPDIIYSNCPNIDYFICAYKVAKLTNLPLAVHMHDLWEENADPESYLLKMAKKWECIILKDASLVLCMTEVQQQHYKDKYGILSELMPHTIKDSDINNSQLEYRPTQRRNIIFTGAISPVMNHDAMKQFAKASHLINSDVKIDICTGYSAENIFSMGFNKNNTEVQWLTRAAVKELQNDSAILFAPLSFKNGGMEEVRTVFSTKLLEYLMSGRPILIFAPSFSHHAISAKKDGWAFVVDEDDPRKIVETAELLLNDDALCRSIVANAFIEAQRRRSSLFALKLAQLMIEACQLKKNARA
jgi:glycosyltransferase involved in cell wall biosynthesis